MRISAILSANNKVNPEKTSGMYVSADNNSKGLSFSLLDDKSLSFKSVNPAMADLRRYANDFRCAYTGKRMISFESYKYIFERLKKNGKSDYKFFNFLNKYKPSFDGVELEAFNFYRNKLTENKTASIQEITSEQLPESYSNLKSKYLVIISSLKQYSNGIKNQQMKARFCATLDVWKNDLLLGNYDKAIASDRYLQILNKMKYKKSDIGIKSIVGEKLRELPDSNSDLDAFIVRYKDASKKQLVKRIVSPFVVSIEHVRAKACGGHASSIANCILVMSKLNTERGKEPLSAMLVKYPERGKHIMEYFHNVIEKINHGGMKEYLWYPFEIKKTIESETKNRLSLDYSGLKISEAEAYRGFIA